MSAVRPDPDALLARVQREEAKAKRGKLKVFFGATAGVGKTYAMLEDARALKARSVDVVVGYVEPHGRAETEALLEGLERLPYRHVAYRGAALRDFDLDAALARKPQILLVDELAHSNPLEGEPRPRHAKRWQDVEELLDAGITVHTTVNVQHVESLNDIVAGITGVRMQETVPDSVFERADEVVMIDTPPDVLLERLQAGEEIANYARERNVTRIVIGRPRRPLWRRLFRPSTYGELVAGTEGIDIMVVGGADEAGVLRNPFFARSRAYMDLRSKKLRWPGYAVGLAAVALCTAIGALTSPMFELVNIAMVYLLAVVLIAVRFGRGPAVTASVLAVAAFDFFFVPPLLTFAVSDVQYHGEPAGLGTDTLPAAEAVYLPLKGSQTVLGVLAVLPANVRRVLLPEQF